MSCTIETERSSYQGRDRIHGIITLRSGTSEPIEFVTVVLRAVAKVRLIKDAGTGPRKHNSKQLLCAQSATVHAEEQILPPGSHDFRFEIPVPTHADRNSGDDVLQPAAPFFGSKDRHHLPPSFSHAVSELEADFSCAVTYVLEVVIHRPASITDLPAIKAEKTLEFVPIRPLLPEPEWKMIRKSFVVRSLRLLPEKANARLSVRERMRSTFKSGELPTATFHAVMWLPIRITQGEPCPVRISIRYGDTTVPAHPVVRLKSAVIQAVADVAVRTRSLVADYRVSHLHMQTILDKSDLDLEIPAGLSDTTAADANDLNMSSLGTDTEHLYLDFATTNVAVSSQLEVELQVVCADKKFQIHGQVPMQVLPPMLHD